MELGDSVNGAFQTFDQSPSWWCETTILDRINKKFNDEFMCKAKHVIFQSLKWGRGGLYFSFEYVQDCRFIQ